LNQGAEEVAVGAGLLKVISGGFKSTTVASESVSTPLLNILVWGLLKPLGPLFGVITVSG
jgi:hypothetical protein